MKEKLPSVKIRATVIPNEGYDYFRRSQGAWNYITLFRFPFRLRVFCLVSYLLPTKALLNNFRELEELVFFDLWIPDSGFRIPVSSFRFRFPIPDSGLVLGFPFVHWDIQNFLTT